jgi:hypothetical protein
VSTTYWFALDLDGEKFGPRKSKGPNRGVVLEGYARPPTSRGCEDRPLVIVKPLRRGNLPSGISFGEKHDDHLLVSVIRSSTDGRYTSVERKGQIETPPGGDLALSREKASQKMVPTRQGKFDR